MRAALALTLLAVVHPADDPKAVAAATDYLVQSQHPDGSWDCLLDIPAWDYHWSSWYQLAAPVKFNPGDLLYVECHWDNTAAHQPPVKGVQPAPRDLHWATAEEMCAGLALFTDTWP